ncbi:MAG: MBL fold metallo-hydrolase [Desulfobacterales bacterium]|nr:MBL fold metallo-hydrolase [Desulfobacterales bacterium]
MTDHTLYKVDDDLFLTMLNPPIEGYDHFLSSWIYRGDITFLVDTGPSVTAGGLVAALESLGINRLDYILLTHVHIDHAGAVGDIAVLFPEATIVCHSRGIPHLVDPTALEEGSLKVLGETAEKYGPIRAVSEKRLVAAEGFMSNTVMPFPAPGHSAHHVCYQTNRYFFVGEACGACFPGTMGPSYMRPATPAPFYLDVALQTLEDIAEMKPERLCFAHFGCYGDAGQLLSRHLAQLRLWESVVNREIGRGTKGMDLELNVLKTLLEHDPLMHPFLDMQGALRHRELFFIQNSIKGFLSNASRTASC